MVENQQGNAFMLGRNGIMLWGWCQSFARGHRLPGNQGLVPAPGLRFIPAASEGTLKFCGAGSDRGGVMKVQAVGSL